MNDLANPLVYGTGLATITGVAIFGLYAIVSGTTAGDYNAFLVAKITQNPMKLSMGTLTNFGAQRGGPHDPNPIPNPIIVKCDFDGTHAAFCDERGSYVGRISNGVPTAPPTGGGGAGGTALQSVTLAEKTNGYALATVGANPGIYIDGETVGMQAFESGLASKFSRSITGTSTQLGALCFAGTQVVAVYVNQSAGAGWTEQAQAPTTFTIPNNSSGTSNYTLGIGTMYTFPSPIPPTPNPINRFNL